MEFNSVLFHSSVNQNNLMFQLTLDLKFLPALCLLLTGLDIPCVDEFFVFPNNNA